MKSNMKYFVILLYLHAINDVKDLMRQHINFSQDNRRPSDHFVVFISYKGHMFIHSFLIQWITNTCLLKPKSCEWLWS